ncbi:MAG: DUF1848 domain-containing protein [Candidatus Omnitrophota bacterium]
MISASRRTDIPAFFSGWFMKRIEDGFCAVRNPYNPGQIARVSLEPDDVEAVVFWTRDPAPLMRRLPELDRRGIRYYFLYTLIGYPRAIDPAAPQVSKAVRTFRELSRRIGKEKMVWRYDPIFFSKRTPYGWHKKRLGYLFRNLRGYTDRLVISFIDPYRKTKLRMRKEAGRGFAVPERSFDPETYRGIARYIGSAAKDAGIGVRACSEEIDCTAYGIERGKCVDDELIGAITGRRITLRKDPSQRKLCGCVVSKDIGVNNTCSFGCTYCYATSSMKSVRKNMKEHNEDSPSLVGSYE